MPVAEVAALTATALAALLARRSGRLPCILAVQSLLLTALELPKLLHFEPWFALAYLAAALVHVAAPPLLLAKLSGVLGERCEKAPKPVLVASAALAAVTLASPFLGGGRILPYALASLTPVLMVVYSRDPVRVSVSLNMASNALHPLIVSEGTLAYAAISNVSITTVIYVAYLLAKEGWRTYGAASLEGWDEWLRR